MTVFEHLRLRDTPEEASSQERLTEIRRLLGAPEFSEP